MAGRFDRLGSRIESATTRYVRLAAARIARQAILNTPVDTGRARANWRVTVGSPALEATLATDQAGSETVGRAEAAAFVAPAGVEIYITNPVNYVVYLNNGRSNQAPANFVEQAVRDGIEIANGEPFLRRRA